MPFKHKKLTKQFYLQDDVVAVAENLLGKIIVTAFNGNITTARIVETEAYNGVADKASHAYGGRRTNRTEIMYANGGVAYVYLCYGMHHLFNVVANKANTPHAVLIRAAEPLQGIEHMLQRTGKRKADYTITKGPGNVSKALGITVKYTGTNLLNGEINIVDDGFILNESEIIVTTRIGVEYAGEDALLPYRFFIKNNPYVSGRKK
ncbi:MAG: DNA-3-methyladenine glycosylase [Chitinophaga sp.]|jgi:DNA-3-methyladenine glycosylase|nr:DNA-3-methyladenine glycosylase [Chitinophaga sp.]